MLDGLNELPSSPGTEVQIYRRRQDDQNRWEYLGTHWDELDVELGHLENCRPVDLDGIAPLDWTRDNWGGGDYQFRFRWRDERGRRRLIRSRDVSIWGRPIGR